MILSETFRQIWGNQIAYTAIVALVVGHFHALKKPVLM